MEDSKIAKLIDEKFLDCKYAVDNPKEGWDCLNFILTFFEELGIPMPHEFEGWTRENYGEKVKKDPDAGHKAFERFVQTLGEEINPNYMQRGDIILFRIKDSGIYAGIDLGNGHTFIIFNKGGRTVPIAPFRPFIVSVRRLLK